MPSKLGTLGKYTFLLKEFDNRTNKTLDSYDEYLQNSLGLGQKQIERLLKDLHNEFSNIEKITIGNKNSYKLIEPIDLLKEALDLKTDIGWLLNMVCEADPETFKQLENYKGKKDNLYKFINTPFEDLSSIEEREVFKKLKRAVENKEYAKIKFLDSKKALDNLKCLKLVFIDNNWYLAFIDEKDRLKLGRISFIVSVDYASKRESFQVANVQKHIDFLDNSLQNSFTIFNVKPKTASIQATKEISKYFDKNMKKFLPSQKFKEKLDDGSVIFTVNYTQALEILPFVQKWLPDLIILEPQELRDEYIKKIQQTLKNYK